MPRSRIVVPYDSVADIVAHYNVVAAVSISGRHHTMPLPPCLKNFGPRLLQLTFDDDGLFGGRIAAQRVLTSAADDLSFPDVFRQESKSGWVDLDTVRSVIGFSRQYKEHFQEGDGTQDLFLAHCFAGHSRSPAVMLTSIATGFGAGREAASVDALIEAAGEGCRPSPMFIVGADYLLGRRGALVRAAKEKGIW